MNLAQLVDPEWVQQGARARAMPAPPQHETVAPQVRTHEAPPPERPGAGKFGAGGPTVLVLRLLAAAGPMGLFSANVREDTGLPATTVSSLLGTLILNGRVRKANAKRPFRFEITQKGRQYLEARG